MTNLISTMARKKKLPMSMRPPRVLARSFPLIPAISTAYDSVQLLGFDLYGSLTLIHSLYGFCSSGQSFAAGFLQIPRHRRHPCLWLYPSHCRADSGLSLVRTCARRAHSKKAASEWIRPKIKIGLLWLFPFRACFPTVFLPYDRQLHV